MPHHQFNRSKYTHGLYRFDKSYTVSHRAIEKRRQTNCVCVWSYGRELSPLSIQNHLSLSISAVVASDFLPQIFRRWGDLVTFLEAIVFRRRAIGRNRQRKETSWETYRRAFRVTFGSSLRIGKGVVKRNQFRFDVGK